MATMQDMFGGNSTSQANPWSATTFQESFGGADKYFGKQLKDLGWSGSVFDNSSLYGNSETGVGGNGQLGANPEFLKWAQGKGLGLSTMRDGDTSFLRLLQGDNVLGEAKYKNANWLDKAAEVGVPLAIAIGMGGMGSEIFGAMSGAGTGAMQGIPSAVTAPAEGAFFNSATPSLSSVGLGGGIPGLSSAAMTGIPSAVTAPAAGAFFDSAVPSLASVGLETASGAPSWLQNVAGSALGSAAKSGAKDLVKNVIGGDKPGSTPGSGVDFTDIFSSLAGIYQGNKYQDSVMDLYKSLDNSFAPGSAYEKQMRQQLDRRDAAAGRRSQYGPREVELQAKLAEMRGNQATTLAGLLDKSNKGLDTMLKSGINIGDATGFNDWLGGVTSNFAKTIGNDLYKDLKNSDWWDDLFGGGD